MVRHGLPVLRSALVAFVLLAVLGGCVDLQPEPTSTPRATSVQPSVVPGRGDPNLAEQIDEVISEVPAVRELDTLSAVPYEFITREQFRDDLIEIAFEDVPEATRAAEERLLKRLGLLPDDADLDQLLIDLYGGQVAAFYRPDTKRFYIIQGDKPFGPSDKIIVAHEYTHALQDQHFDLEGTRIKDLSEGDATLGQLAAVEGDATLTMQLWAQANLSSNEWLQVGLEALAQLQDQTLANMPPILRRQLEFPYAEGFVFVQDVHGSGGFAAVNESLQDAPESTEQVLHPEKYYADEQPADVQTEDMSSELGPGWSRVYEQTIGELIMQVLLAGDETPEGAIPGLPADWPHAEAAAGWGGDRLVMYEGPDGAWLIDWQTAWDTQADTDEFASRVIELQPTLEGHLVVDPGPELNGRRIQVMLADSVTTMDLVQPPR